MPTTVLSPGGGSRSRSTWLSVEPAWRSSPPQAAPGQLGPEGPRVGAAPTGTAQGPGQGLGAAQSSVCERSQGACEGAAGGWRCCLSLGAEWNGQGWAHKLARQPWRPRCSQRCSQKSPSPSSSSYCLRELSHADVLTSSPRSFQVPTSLAPSPPPARAAEDQADWRGRCVKPPPCKPGRPAGAGGGSLQTPRAQDARAGVVPSLAAPGRAGRAEGVVSTCPIPSGYGGGTVG